MDKYDELINTVELLTKRVEALERARDISALMDRFVLLFSGRRYNDCAALFADAEDVSVELGALGLYEGRAAVYSFFAEHCYKLAGDCVGFMTELACTTPVIEPARDGKSAKGLWVCPGQRTSANSSELTWGKLAAEFLCVEDEWKLWHLHYFPDFVIPAAMPENDSASPDTPASYRGGYSPGGIKPHWPWAPDKYRTYEGTMRIVGGDPPMFKDAGDIQPGMLHRDDRPCENTRCLYRGYCELCISYHARMDGKPTACRRDSQAADHIGYRDED